MIDLVNKCLDQFLASDDYGTLCEKYGLKQLGKLKNERG